jgi:glycosyltransferase involved in cell wall biosynthesis
MDREMQGSVEDNPITALSRGEAEHPELMGAQEARLPKVSVIIPAYNTARYIRDTLESVLAQSFRDYEVIVVNDGSPDTPELERVLLEYQSQICYIKQENRGLAGARNTGIRHALGEFLAFPDSDDIWLPDFLSEQLRFFAEHPCLDMACADCVYFGNPELEGTSWQSLDPMEDPVTFEKILPTHGGAFASFVILRRETVLKVGLFDEALRMLEDYHYWLKFLYRGGRMAYLRKVLGKRRIHGGSLTYNVDIVPDAIKALRRLQGILDPADREAALVQKEIAFSESRLSLQEGRRRVALGDHAGARESFAKAYAVVPSRKVALTLLGLRWFPRPTRWAISRWDRHLLARADR